MAQRKNKEESIVQVDKQVQVENTPQTETQEVAEMEAIEEATGNSETEEVEKPKDKPKTRKKEVEDESEDIPEQALRILKMYPKEQSLYIGNHGGVYSSNSPQNVRGNATLYKNPFYKSK